MPQVSVIIPTYNAAQYISNAIDSVLSQTFKDYEILVVDDGSTDNTKDVLQKYQGVIKYIYQGNRGPSAARNVGIKHAKGEFIAFLDADDIWFIEKLHLQMNEMRSSSSSGIVACGRRIVKYDGSTEIIQPKLNKLMRRDLLKKLLLGNCIGGGSVALIRRSCFDIVGYFDEKLYVSEDRDMWYRLCQRFEYREVMQPLIEYRLVDGSQSYYSSKNLASQLTFLHKVFAKKKNNVSIYFKRKVLSEHYFSAAWSSWFCNDRKEAKRLIIIAWWSNPIHALFRNGFLGLFVRIILGDYIFNLVRRKRPNI